MPTIRAASTPKILTVKFDGPHPAYSETRDVLADCKNRKEGGIYFWAIRVGDSFRITHIGQTGTSFYQRMKEHIINTLGGNYRISDTEALARGDSKILWDGLWREGVPLVLSGHTHAGQITVARLHEIAIGKVGGHKYVHGLYGTRSVGEEATGAVYVGAGVGAAVMPLRLGARARREVTVFELGANAAPDEADHAEQPSLAGRKPSDDLTAKRHQRVLKLKAKRESNP